MNGQYSRPPGQGNVAPSTLLQRGNSSGSVGHRGGHHNLGGISNAGSIGGLGGQLSVGLSMNNRGGSNMPAGGQGRSSVLGPAGALSVGARSGSAPAPGYQGYGGVGNPMSGMGGDEVHQDMASPSFGAEDFPSLGGLGAPRAVNEMPPSLAGLAAHKVTQESHFQMATEDFPALAGQPNNKSDSQPGGNKVQDVNTGFSAAVGSHQAQAGHKSGQQQQGDGVSPYGLLGLLNVIQMTSADLNTLALGTDLTTLGLNLNSTEPLWTTFASPWADAPCRREPDFTLPHCYYMQPPTLKTGHIQKFQLETLFYIFYMMPKDTLQAVAASELHARDWKFHSELSMWFCKQPETQGKGGFGRAATFVYFDVKVWERRTYVDNSKNLEQGFLAEDEVAVQFAHNK